VRKAVSCRLMSGDTTAPTSAPIGFTPVAIAGPEQSEPPPAASPSATSFTELEFGRGVRLRISSAVDPRSSGYGDSEKPRKPSCRLRGGISPARQLPVGSDEMAGVAVRVPLKIVPARHVGWERIVGIARTSATVATAKEFPANREIKNFRLQTPQAV
jgi:hypothetical protein